MLLQEEQYIIHWLTEYGPLPKAQIVRMLKDKPPKTAEKIIRALKNEVMLHEISGGYYLGVDPMCQPDQRMILAVWVLLQFIDRVDPMAHYPATYPSQIFFLKEDIGYEIVVLYDGEQHLTRLLQPQEDLRYILSCTYQHGAGAGLAICASPVCDCGLQRSRRRRMYGSLRKARGTPMPRSEFERGAWSSGASGGKSGGGISPYSPFAGSGRTWPVRSGRHSHFPRR